MNTGLPNGGIPSSRARAGASKPASIRPRSFVVPARPDIAIDAVIVFTWRQDAVACWYALAMSGKGAPVPVGSAGAFGAQALEITPNTATPNAQRKPVE